MIGRARLCMTRLLAVIGLVGACHSALAELKLPLTKLPSPSITTSVRVVRENCQSQDRRVIVTVNVQPEDVGRPGIAYVGVHDDGQNEAFFLAPSGWWARYNGGMFQPFAIMQGGVQAAIQLSFIAPSLYSEQLQGWHLYVGYGALSVADEAKVQRGVDSVARAKAMMPDRKIPAFDPDHFRLSLVQKDMTEKYKYRHILQWDSPEIINALSINGWPCTEM